MLQKIAEITGFPFNQDDEITMTVLQRISSKIPAGIDETHPEFAEAVSRAEALLNEEGQVAIAALVKQIVAPPPEKVFKIKASPKGARIKIAAANGVKFSFGPIWNDAVKAAKGIALNPANREKLNHQAQLYGIENPGDMDVQNLCAILSQKL